MASPFDWDSKAKPPLDPYARERIDDEIAHLRKRGTVRHTDGRTHGLRAAWPALLVMCALLWLFFMDPVLHAFRRQEAIRTYLYLHQLGNDRKAQQLLDTGIFAPTEVQVLNLRQGPFQTYYSGPSAADQSVDSIIEYLKGVSNLRAGAYDTLSVVGKLRYQLFVRWGILPPEILNLLEPSIHE